MATVGSGIKCMDCRDVKPEDSFWRNASRPNGRQLQCIACLTKLQKDARERQRDIRTAIRADELAAREEAGKACRKCGVTRRLAEYKLHRNGIDGRESVCIPCRNLRSSERRQALRAAGQYPSPSDRPEARRAYAEAAGPRIRATRIATRAEQRRDLADWWVRKLLAQGLKVKESEIPQSLVEVKRQHLKLVRLLKEKTAS